MTDEAPDQLIEQFIKAFEREMRIGPFDDAKLNTAAHLATNLLRFVGDVATLPATGENMITFAELWFTGAAKSKDSKEHAEEVIKNYRQLIQYVSDEGYNRAATVFEWIVKEIRPNTPAKFAKNKALSVSGPSFMETPSVWDIFCSYPVFIVK